MQEGNWIRVITLQQGVHIWLNKVQLSITAALGTATRHLATWSYPFKKRNMEPNNLSLIIYNF